MRRVAILLRAVNVGGRQLSMVELKALLAAAGYDSPETLLASGNAFVGSERSQAEIEADVARRIEGELGLRTDVFVRDHERLTEVIAANPFHAFARTSPNRLMTVFLKADPPPGLPRMSKLAAPEEAFAPGPRCLYICYPEGAGRSRLAGGRSEASEGTARNWNTVLKLSERLGRSAR